MSALEQSMPPQSSTEPTANSTATTSNGMNSTVESGANTGETNEDDSALGSSPAGPVASEGTHTGVSGVGADSKSIGTNDTVGTSNGTGQVSATMSNGGSDWRDKDADRSTRQQIAKIIFTLIMKSSNRPQSADYNPREIARRLEHMLYMGAKSKDEYKDLHTLKARLQQALNSSRRQQRQQNPSASSAPSNASTSAQSTSVNPDQTQQQLQQQQMQLLQRQQQQLAAQFQSSRNSLSSAPFSQQPMASMGTSQVNPSTTSMPMAASSSSMSANNASILDELERETNEMANGISDKPIEMPASELQPGAKAVAGFGDGSDTSGAMNAGAVSSAQFNSVPMSVPLDMSGGMSSGSVGNFSSQQQSPAMVSAPAMSSGMYSTMGLSGPQLQQMQQMQQMQQLRRMQQLQQMQQRQAASSSMAMNTSGSFDGSGNSRPAAVPMNDASIAQKREELKRRLIQLKHARTCSSNNCSVEYCGRTRALLAHVSRCADANCATVGCKSTRQLLSHFRKCRNLRCDVCSAIRPRLNENEQKLVLRRQQERLCMLRHVSTCNSDSCPLPYCSGMKLLWKHICSCKQPQCRTEHCISSRYVLSHFKQCSKLKCDVCGPVQHAIRLVDAAKGDATKLQTHANQAPDNVRALVKVMNTTTAVINATTSASNHETGSQASNGDASGDGIMDKSVDESDTADTSGQKKPVRLQSEKEKKMRRKEQAKVAKARAQAKTQRGRGKAEPMVLNGLVVRGTQADLQNGQHSSDQDISYLDSMSAEQLEEHIRSLRFSFCGHISLPELKNRLMPLLTKLMESEFGWTFNSPVDPVQWNIPDYFDIVKCPMDLGTIKKRLENEHYNSVEAFAGDVRLVFENCIAYNSSANKFNQAAKQLLASFNRSLASLKKQLENQLFKRCEQRRDEICQLCGGDSFKFAPCMLFCSGPCGGRIRRHTHYYSDPRGEHHWCSNCYKQMKDGPIDMSALPQLSVPTAETSEVAPGGIAPFDGVLTKSSLVKRKNSEVAEEPWVECDACKLWYHQICALFNERNHAISGEQEPFVCPVCTKKQRASGVPPSVDNGLKARRLPLTRMAKLIEERVLRSLKQAEEEEDYRMGNLGSSDRVGTVRGSEPVQSDTKLRITIREVLSVEKQVQVKPRLGKLLEEEYGGQSQGQTDASLEIAGTKTPKKRSLKRKRSGADSQSNGKEQTKSGNGSSLQLTYRSRCICVFQELEGVDVLIFTLYVQEYGPDSLSPNAGRVYVSYLDSVNFFLPKKFRTLMHQQVMLGFFEDCKNRGFHTAHIWSCPPLKGDDYIFFCKPENQKIPKSARLRQWYQKLLKAAQKEGLVVNISNLYAEYYLKKKRAVDLPYFEGDYWPRLAEDLIKQLEEKPANGRGEKTAEGQETSVSTMEAKSPTASPVQESSSYQKQTNEKKRGKKDKEPKGAATRSASKSRSKKGGKAMNRPSTPNKVVVNPDPLMQKLKGILEPQKDDFFVVDLYPKCHKCGQAMVNQGYWHLTTHKPSAAVANLLEAVKKIRPSSSSVRNTPPRHYQHYYCTSCYEANKTQLSSRLETAAVGVKRAEEVGRRLAASNEKASASELTDLDLQELKFPLTLEYVEPTVEQEEKAPAIKEEKIEAGTSDKKEESLDAYVKKESTEGESKDTKTEEGKEQATRKSDGEIDDVVMPCEIFDTREAFLMYCQNNHCQFDQLRRAKHSSMMVLYHLFNQGTTGFTFSCSRCKTALVSGNRWNCSVCPVFNLCDDCKAKSTHEHTLHLFKIVPIPRPGAGLPLDDPVAIEAQDTAAALAQDPSPPAGRGRPSKKKQATSSTKTPKSTRKRKLQQASPAGSPASADHTETSADSNTEKNKQRRIHNVDPNLLVQLDHSSTCTDPECTFMHCKRMRAMLQHERSCEQRQACLLCRRIRGVLAAHARQCTKPYDECKVQRCADMRRYLQQQAARSNAAASTSSTTSDAVMAESTQS